MVYKVVTELGQFTVLPRLNCPSRISQYGLPYNWADLYLMGREFSLSLADRLNEEPVNRGTTQTISQNTNQF